MLVKVRGMQSHRSYRIVPNQFIIETPTFEVFQSYNSIIAIRNKQTGKVALDKETWNYSNTTSKYRRDFLGEGIDETRRKVEAGEYSMENLN